MIYFSQFGEDKFLESFLPQTGYFVDIGAYDGLRFSNTQMVYQRGWSGLAVETNLKYFESLMVNMPDSRVIKIPRHIQREELDKLLKVYGVPFDFDLLSIDIDSYDYELWLNSKIYFPKFVIIETNGKNTNDILKLAKDKGYELIWDEANLIFKKI